MTTVVYTDGACIGNPGPGGWAWAEPGGAWASGAAALTTNQRMEITAAFEAVVAHPGPVEVVSDSTYVVNCFRDRWWEGWLARGWVNTARKPVANRDLWEPFVEAYRARPGEVSFRWVKGHATDPVNDLVDRLAVDAARSQTGRSGVGQPDDLPAPDAPASKGSADDPVAKGDQDPRVPAGHRVVVTGHRPPGLGGYDANPTAEGVRRRLGEILAAKRQLHDDLVVMTGLGLGAEQLAAEAASASAVPYVAVLAFPDQESVWPAASKQRYRRLLEGAEGQVLLQAKAPETKQKAGAALARRDAWLARNAAEAVVVWDGEDAALGRTVRSLQDHVGEDDVWVVSP